MASEVPSVQEEADWGRAVNWVTHTASESSPSERIPVEIWHRILSIAIACTLLPREDDNYCQRRDVAKLGCAKIHEYVTSERIRTQLRLVCRSWGDFLEQHSDRLVYFSWRVAAGHWPPIKKWERVVQIVGPDFLMCMCKEPGRCLLSLSFKEKILVAGEGTPPATGIFHEHLRSLLSSVGPRCGAIVMPGFLMDDLVAAEHFGSVTMLCEDLRGPKNVICNSYRNLIHLSIVVSFLFIPTFHLCLPHLATLNISFIRTSSNPQLNPNSDIIPSRWDVPQLRCITFNGVFDENTICCLLQLFARRVTECHFLPTSFGHGLNTLVTKNIWAHLPALRVLGVTVEQFISLSPPIGTEDATPIDILVHWGSNYKYIPPPVEGDHLIEPFYRKWSALTLGRLSIDVSWAELVRGETREDRERAMAWGIRNVHQGEPEVADVDVWTFDILDALGHGLLDRDEVRFDESIKSQIQLRVSTHVMKSWPMF